MYHSSSTSYLLSAVHPANYPKHCHVLAPPPPPYQETLPENHTYKSGTRIVQTITEIEPTLFNPQEVHFSSIHPKPVVSNSSPHLNQIPKPKSDLNATYEHAYCHNLILPMSLDGSSAGLGSLSQAAPPAPSTSKRICDIWRQLTKRKKSKKVMKIKTATLRRCSSQHNVCKVQTATLKRSISNHKISKEKVCSSEALFFSKNDATPPPKGIIKAPRRVPRTPLSTDYTAMTNLVDNRRGDIDALPQPLQQLKKCVSFSGQLNRVHVFSPELKDEDFYFKFPWSYAANDYVFTKL